MPNRLLLLLALAVFSNALTAQVGGSLMQFPPQELYLEITEDAEGRPSI